MTLRNKGVRRRRVLSVGGEVEVARGYFWGKGSGGVFPVDEALGVTGGVSPGAREVLCRLGMTQDFAQAAEDAARIGGMGVSKERLRGIVESEAKAVRQDRESGRLAASWTAGEAKVVMPDGSQTTRVYQGTDGVMVPTVTEAEKQKRREKQAAKRRERGKAMGVSGTCGGQSRGTGGSGVRRGSDEKFKEMKIGTFYNQTKTRRHAFVTEGDSKSYGPLLKSYAAQISLHKAVEVICLIDGAKWIAAQLTLALLTMRVLLLDFYHLSQHVHATAVCCLGDTDAAREWARDRLREFKQTGVTPVLTAIERLLKTTRSKAKRKSLESLREYLTSRLDMLHYRQAIARGWDIGSGPTEAMCKTLTLRLKRPGMKWDRDHAADMMNLTAMYESGQARNYWDKKRRAA